VPKGVVVLKPGSTLTEAELIEFCRSHLSHYKCPRSIEFCETLPKNPIGKVLRRELRKKFSQGSERLRQDV
jgi:acyl-CoA synthetase (AMP-forming)/AMP-acid ligase II